MTAVGDQFGRADILVNSAGFTRMVPHADQVRLTGSRPVTYFEPEEPAGRRRCTSRDADGLCIRVTVDIGTGHWRSQQ